MKQLTAIEWFFDKIKDHIIQAQHFELLQQAKEMEKEQIGKAYISGGYAGLHFPLTKDAFYRKYLEDKFTEYYKTNYTNGL